MIKKVKANETYETESIKPKCDLLSSLSICGVSARQGNGDGISRGGTNIILSLRLLTNFYFN